MGQALSRDLQALDDFLLDTGWDDGALLLSGLDGLLAGVAVCSGSTIPPSEWLPMVWGGEAPAFDDEEEAELIVGLILKHYDDVVGRLDRRRYEPIYDIDSDGSPLWETWMDGFDRAVVLRPDAWGGFDRAGDAEVRGAWLVLARLNELAAAPVKDRHLVEGDEALLENAPDLIPRSVQILYRAGAARGRGGGREPSGSRKVGRNDPCPCGSGRKYKHCCLGR